MQKMPRVRRDISKAREICFARPCIPIVITKVFIIVSQFSLVWELLNCRHTAQTPVFFLNFADDHLNGFNQFLFRSLFPALPHLPAGRQKSILTKDIICSTYPTKKNQKQSHPVEAGLITAISIIFV